ncbi:MAG: DUF302 domain-containing protein, partial [Fibrobacterota bacterium]
MVSVKTGTAKIFFYTSYPRLGSQKNPSSIFPAPMHRRSSAKSDCAKNIPLPIFRAVLFRPNHSEDKAASFIDRAWQEWQTQTVSIEPFVYGDPMKYYYETKSALSFEETHDRVTHLLKEEGFGVLSEIAIHEKLKKKLGVDYPPYVILGACNPPNAYKALQTEPYIGTMLPCNVVIREDETGQIT